MRKTQLLRIDKVFLYKNKAFRKQKYGLRLYKVVFGRRASRDLILNIFPKYKEKNP